MEDTNRISSSSQLFGIKFPDCSEISSPTRLALGVLSMFAAIYVAVRNMNGRSFSIDALSTAEKITAGAFLALGLFFQASALVSRVKDRERERTGKVSGAGPLPDAPEIPFKDQLPSWVIQTIGNSKVSRSVKSFEGTNIIPIVSFEGIPDSIVFAEDSKVYGIHLKLQATHSDPSSEALPIEIAGFLYKAKENQDGSWRLFRSNEFQRILQDDLVTNWNPQSDAVPTQPDGVSDLDSFRGLNMDVRGKTSPLDWMLSRLLTGKECRIQDQNYGEKIKQYWSLSLSAQPSSSSSSSGQD